MESIPDDILFNIFLFFPVRSLSVLILVCVRWCTLFRSAEHDFAFWENYCRRNVGSSVPNKVTWKKTTQIASQLFYAAKKNPHFAFSRCCNLGFENLALEIINHCPEIDLKNDKSVISCGYPLHLAIRKQFTELIQVLMDQGTSLTFSDGKCTPKEAAAKTGNMEILLLVCPEDVISQPNLLHTALANKKSALSRSMINLGVDILCENQSGDAAIHIAAFAGLSDIVEMLITKKGIPVDSPNRSKLSPLQRACSGGNLDTVKLLVSLGASVNYSENSIFPCVMKPLYFAIKHAPSNSERENLEVARFLLPLTEDPALCRDKLGNLLHAAIRKREFLEFLELLLPVFVNPNERGRKQTTVIGECLISGKLDSSTFDLLVKYGADPSLALPDIFHLRNVELVEFLMSRGAKITSDSHFFTALQWFDPKIIALIDGYPGQNLTYVKPHGETMLYALMNGISKYYQSTIYSPAEISEMVEKHFIPWIHKLVKAGVDVNGGPDEMCPLDYVVPDHNIVDVLISYGAKFSCETDQWFHYYPSSFWKKWVQHGLITVPPTYHLHSLEYSSRGLAAEDELNFAVDMVPLMLDLGADPEFRTRVYTRQDADITYLEFIKGTKSPEFCEKISQLILEHKKKLSEGGSKSNTTKDSTTPETN